VRRTERQQIAILREALRPFARAFEDITEPVQRMLAAPVVGTELRVHHLRAAVLALEETEP